MTVQDALGTLVSFKPCQHQDKDAISARLLHRLDVCYFFVPGLPPLGSCCSPMIKNLESQTSPMSLHFGFLAPSWVGTYLTMTDPLFFDHRHNSV